MGSEVPSALREAGTPCFFAQDGPGQTDRRQRYTGANAQLNLKAAGDRAVENQRLKRMNMGNVPQKQKHCNEVHLRGILARDPELRKTASGKLVANVTVATTYETRTEFHKCVFWEELAERLSDAFHKGDFISLHGRLQTRSWDADGIKRYTTEVVVWNFSDGTTEKNAHGVEVSADDIPF